MSDHKFINCFFFHFKECRNELSTNETRRNENSSSYHPLSVESLVGASNSPMKKRLGEKLLDSNAANDCNVNNAVNSENLNNIIKYIDFAKDNISILNKTLVNQIGKLAN